MAGNYGTSGYGIGNNAAGAKAAGGATGIGAIAQFIIGRMAEPRAGAMDEAHRQQQEQTKGQDINAESSSPFGVADTMGSQAMPGSEKMLPVNWKPMEVAPGQTNAGPVNVDSGQQPYKTSGMMNYLNYMNYRGGY
jgi:hypothetical protein